MSTSIATFVNRNVELIHSPNYCIAQTHERKCYLSELKTYYMDMHYELDGPNIMMLTNNAVAGACPKFFTDGEPLFCALYRI